MSRLRLPALAVAMIVLGAWACTAAASDSRGDPLAQVSKKQKCKKKGAKKKKKCKAPGGGAAETPLSVAITSCPSGSVSGSSVATITGTAAVGPHITTYISFDQVDSYFDAPIRDEIRVYPNASGVWSYSFTPGFPESWGATASWEEQVVAANYRAHDARYAQCAWTVVP